MSKTTTKPAKAGHTAKKPDPQKLMKEIEKETLEGLLDNQVP
jgi:hypothetical protein